MIFINSTNHTHCTYCLIKRKKFLNINTAPPLWSKSTNSHHSTIHGKGQRVWTYARYVGIAFLTAHNAHRKIAYYVRSQIFYRKRKLILDANSTSRITSSCSTSLLPSPPSPPHPLSPLLPPSPSLPTSLLPLQPSPPLLTPPSPSLPSPPLSSPHSTLHAHVAVSSTPLHPAPHGRGRQCENTLSSCVGLPLEEEDDHGRRYLP